MVLINRHQQLPRRQQSLPNVHQVPVGESSLAARNSSFTCAMGDDDSCSISTISSHHSLGSSFGGSFPLQGKRSSSILNTSGGGLLPSTFNGLGNPVKPGRPVPRWMLPLLYALTIFSWIRAIQHRYTSVDIMAALDSEIESLTASI
jgi:hypothetical protein